MLSLEFMKYGVKAIVIAVTITVIENKSEDKTLELKPCAAKIKENSEICAKENPTNKPFLVP